MKISKICSKNGKAGQPTTVSLDTVVEKMRTGRYPIDRKMPALVFGATFGRGGFEEIRTMTRLVVLTFRTEHADETRNLQKLVSKVSHTLLAFRDENKLGLNVVVRVDKAGGEEISSVSEYEELLKVAHTCLSSYYMSLTGRTAERVDVSAKSAVSMSYDNALYYNPEADDFHVVLEQKNLQTQYSDVIVNANGTIEEQFDYNELERRRLEYYSCLNNALKQHPDDDKQEEALIELARACQRAHLPEEECIKRTLLIERPKCSEDLVRKIFRATYARKHRGKAVSQMNKEEIIARTVRDFFQRRYQLRYNEVKQITEFRPISVWPQRWQPLTGRDKRTFAFEAMLEGGQGWKMDVDLYVDSSLVRTYNPIHEFLAGVGTWNKHTNYIEEYARRLPTNYERWPHFFHRWFLAMVAQALNVSRDFGNSMVPILIGSQAMKKSTFCKNILPPSMREYYMDDIKMDNAEQVERVLGRMWLVNIDEYNAKTDGEQAKIKRLLTEKDVQVRKMRSDQYTMKPRLCSFIATTNDPTPLSDPTGSRRYLCVETTGPADMSGSINYQQMFAQAVYEIENGAKYWFDNDDEKEITEHNSAYQQYNSVEDTINTLFEAAPHEKQYLMTTTAIQKHMSQHLPSSDVPSLKKLGKALIHHHFHSGALRGVHGFYVKTKCP